MSDFCWHTLYIYTYIQFTPGYFHTNSICPPRAVPGIGLHLTHPHTDTPTYQTPQPPAHTLANPPTPQTHTHTHTHTHTQREREEGEMEKLNFSLPVAAFCRRRWRGRREGKNRIVELYSCTVKQASVKLSVDPRVGSGGKGSRKGECVCVCVRERGRGRKVLSPFGFCFGRGRLFEEKSVRFSFEQLMRPNIPPRASSTEQFPNVHVLNTLLDNVRMSFWLVNR